MSAYFRDLDPVVGRAAGAKRKLKRLEELYGQQTPPFIQIERNVLARSVSSGAVDLAPLWAGGLVDPVDPLKRMGADDESRRDAFSDPAVAARALHSPHAMNLRSRAYTRDPTTVSRDQSPGGTVTTTYSDGSIGTSRDVTIPSYPTPPGPAQVPQQAPEGY